MNHQSVIDMNRNGVRDAVHAAISECLAVRKEDLRDELRVVEDLNADSMDVVSILLLLDASLGIEIEPHEIPNENVRIGWIIDELTAKLSK